MDSRSRSGVKPNLASMLEDLLTSERPKLLRQARRNSNRTVDAEDALATACVQFLRFYDGQAGVNALRWMMLVVKRCAWQLSGQESKTLPVPFEADEPVAVVLAERHENADPADLVERRAEVSEVAALMAQLKPAERDALVLLGLGYSYKEIAEIQGWTLTKVNRCLTEGRAALRRDKGGRES
jgi:RNA polymerase sigma factor (sigma-70 family)